jgi:hypothetical protein
MDGYIPSPYVKSKAPSSSEIQALMNKAEEEYVTWRQTRKPIHHPNVSQKVNSPLTALVVHSPSKRKKSPITPVRLPILSKDEKLKLELEELRHSPLVRTPLLKTTCSSAVILGISTVRSTRNQSNHPSHSFYQPRFSVIANQIISQKEQEQMPEEGGKRGREGEKRGGEEEEGGGHQGIASLKPFTAPVKNSKKGNLFKDLKIEITERSISTADVCDGSAVIPLQPGISPTTSTGGKLHFPPELEDAIVDYRIVNMDTHDGNKHIQEHLYDFYTRQVFCIHEDTSESSNRERDEGEEDEYKDEEDDEDTLLAEYQQVELLQRQASSTRSLLSTPSSATTPSVKSRSPSSAIFRQSSSKIKHSTSSELEKLALVSAIAAGYPSNGCLVVDKTTFIPQYEYDAIFEMDWQQSNVDKIICDAVERKRICTILKPVYRVVIWHFHFYAASIGLLRGDPFRIHDKNKFLEALNVVPCADLSKYNISKYFIL